MARTVLLADDSVTAQNMGRRILMDAGYEVVTVNNGSAALKKIHESRPDLIVLDVYMPGYGGLEVCQRLKESSETMRIPVLLTVGKMEPFKTDEARRVRADGHIVKPFDASELLAALTRLEDRIVPEANGRGKKAKAEKVEKAQKSEKKARFWHAADPTTTFDDSQSDSIAYLAQVKQRHTRHEPEASEEVRESPQLSEVAAKPLPEIVEAEAPSASEPVRSHTESLPEPVGELEVVPEAVGAQIQEGVESTSAEQPESVPVAEAQAVSGAVIKEEAAPVPQIELPIVEGTASSTRPVEDPALKDAEPATVEKLLETGQSEGVATIEPANPPGEAAVPDTLIEAQSADTKAAGSRWVAENVALTPEEASLELEQEMRRAEMTSAESQDVSASAGFEPAVDLPSEPQVSPEVSAGATFAAAAAGSSANAVSSGNLAASAPENEPERTVAPEAAAAWKNWEQIRDSVMNPQQANAIAESVAEVTKSVAPVAQADSAPEDHSTSALEGAALASIVDTVLAELKPKLMEEIAKKLKK